MSVSELILAYKELTAQHMLAGADALYELAGKAKAIVQETSGPERTLAFTLFSIFHSLAQHQDGAAVSETDAENTFHTLNGPISNSLEYLSTGADVQTLFGQIVELVNAYVPPPKFHS